MEKKILEYISDCQKNMHNGQNLQQMEEIIQSLINIIYILMEQYSQTVEEQALKSEKLETELSEIQFLYKNAMEEIKQIHQHHQKQLEEFSFFEDKLLQEEQRIKTEKENEIQTMKSSHKEMFTSLKLQQQFIRQVTQQNENQQCEIQDLMKKIVNLKQCQTDQNSEHDKSELVSQQSLVDIKENISVTESSEKINQQMTIMDNYQDLQPQVNSQNNLLTFTRNSSKSLKYIPCHSKNQSINWVKLATIVQTLQSHQQSLTQIESQLKEQQERLSKDLSTDDYTPYSFNSKNPYQIFFSLLCQSVKLDLNENQYYLVQTDHLYQQFTTTGVPFHKWYNKIKLYILNQQ